MCACARACAVFSLKTVLLVSRAVSNAETSLRFCVFRRIFAPIRSRWIQDFGLTIVEQSTPRLAPLLIGSSSPDAADIEILKVKISKRVQGNLE